MDKQKLIEELKALEAQATPGPWDTCSHYSHKALDISGCRGAVGYEITPGDAQLTVAMRNALPGLLDYIAQLEAERDAAVEDIAHMHLCRHCINGKRFADKLPPCDTCADNGKPNWQWRNPARKG